MRCVGTVFSRDKQGTNITLSSEALPIPTLKNVIVSLPDSATLLNMPSATLSRAIATSIFTILASYALWDSHSPSRRKQRLRRQVRKKNLFTYAAPLSQTIISSFRVISTNGDCPRVRSAKCRSGNLCIKSSATQDSRSGNALSDAVSVALEESTLRQVVLDMHEQMI